MKRIFAVVMCMCIFAVGQANAGDMGRVVKSVVFPGMGQLGDGSGELGHASTIKGLAFMSLEAIALSLTVAEVSKASSYARETEYIQVKYHLATTYEDRLREFNNWQDAYDKSAKSKTMTMAYGGVAAAIWILNVVDIIVFEPKETNQSMIRTLLNNTLVSASSDGARIAYKATF